MLLGGGTEALDKFCAALVVSFRSEVAGADGPIVRADIDGISSERSAQGVLLNPVLGSFTLREDAGGKLRFLAGENPDDVHGVGS